MHSIVGLTADAAVFVFVPWIGWRLLGRTIPFAVLPIVVGLGVAAFGGASAELGIPSALGIQLGWAGVLLLAFTAGVETRMMAATSEEDALSIPRLGPVPLRRLVSSAFVALLLPLLAGTLVAYCLRIDLIGTFVRRGVDIHRRTLRNREALPLGLLDLTLVRPLSGEAAPRSTPPASPRRPASRSATSC